MIQYACLSEVWGADAADPKRKKSKKSGSVSVPTALGASSDSIGHPHKEPLCDLYQGHVDNIMDTYLTEYPFDKYARVSKEPEPVEDLRAQHCAQERAGNNRPSFAAADVKPSSMTYDLTQKDAQGPIPEADAFFPYDDYYKNDTHTLASIQGAARVEEEAAVQRALATASASAHASAVGTEQVPQEMTAYGDEDAASNDDYEYSRGRSSNARGNTPTDWYDLIAYISSGILLIFIMEQFLKIGLHMRV